MSSKLSWYKLADNLSDLAFGTNGLVQVEIEGKKLCLSLHEGQLAACAAKCPHAGGILAEGFIDGMGHLVCPLHRYRFSLQNGRNTSGEGYYLKTFPIETRADGIYVGIADTGFFSWLK